MSVIEQPLLRNEAVEDDPAIHINVTRIHETIRYIWEKRRLVLRFAACGLVLSLAAAYLIPVKYEAVATLMPPDLNSGSALMGLALAQSDSSSGALGGLASILGSRSTGELFIAALGTTVVEDRIIERFDLRKVYGRRLWKDAREKLEDRSDMKEDRKSGVITITVRDRDPERAAKIANAFAEELDRLVQEMGSAAARKEIGFLDQRVATAKEELQAASKGLADFSAKNGTIDMSVQTKAMVDSAALLQGQLVVAEADLRAQQQLYTGKHELVQQTKARIAELRRQRDALVGQDLSPDKNASPDQIAPPIRNLPLLGVPYMDFYRRAKIAEAVYEHLVERYQVLKLQEGRYTLPLQVQVLDPAKAPEDIAFPPRLALVIGGVLAWSLAGFGWIILRRWWQETDAQAPSRQLLQPVADAITARTSHLRARFSFLSANRFRKPAPTTECDL